MGRGGRRTPPVAFISYWGFDCYGRYRLLTKQVAVEDKPYAGRRCRGSRKR